MRVVLFSLCTLVSASSVATPVGWCWTEKIENASDGMHVYLDKFHPGVSISYPGIKNTGPTEFGPDGSFLLREGGTAYLQGLHDGCTLVAERQTDELGIRFKSAFHPHGLPPVEREQFYSGGPVTQDRSEAQSHTK